MKLGFGLYRHMLDDAHCAFARQCGATDVIVHLRRRVPVAEMAAGDVPRAIRILRDAGFDGAGIPDHAAQMACAAPGHAGMAFAVGCLHAPKRTG